MSESEIARIKETIALEYMVAKWGLTGFAQGQTRHAFISQRMQRIEEGRKASESRVCQLHGLNPVLQVLLLFEGSQVAGFQHYLCLSQSCTTGSLLFGLPWLIDIPNERTTSQSCTTGPLLFAQNVRAMLSWVQPSQSPPGPPLLFAGVIHDRLCTPRLVSIPFGSPSPFCPSSTMN